VRLSDGSIQNKYTLKILNKMPEALSVRISVDGPQNLTLVGADAPVVVQPGAVTPATVLVKVPRRDLQGEQQPIAFHVEAERVSGDVVAANRESVFIAPRFE
jgi:hypothetical protein